MKKILLFLILCLMVPVVAFAQDVNDSIMVLLELVAPFLAQYADQWPWLAVVLKVMVYTRIFFKPLMSAAMKISQDFPETKYQAFMKSMSDHWFYKLFAYLLDWFASIKLPKK
jgi:hypothetical protein